MRPPFERAVTRPRILRRILAHSLVLSVLLSLPAPCRAVRPASWGAQERKDDARTLEPGKSLNDELGGGQSHTYQLALEAGQFVCVVVEQRGIDLVATLFAPDGTKVAEVDSPFGTEGQEPLFWVAGSSFCP